jgi:replicative DNA helicase
LAAKVSSLEVLAISAVIAEGAAGLRKIYAEGVTKHDFPIYEDEFTWIEERLSAKKTMNKRVFLERFPDFEYLVPDSRIQDLAKELKEERAFEEINSLASSMVENLTKDNALDVANQVRDRLSLVTRAHMPRSDEWIFGDWQEHYDTMKQALVLHAADETIGIPTGFSRLDFQWGGFQPSETVLVLGRTGEGKTYVVMQFAWVASKYGYRVGIFSPEMVKSRARNRMHTLASADSDVQAACGLPSSFRNTALNRRKGFNIKQYRRFVEYMASLPGDVMLFSGVNRKGGMSISYIEDRVAEIGFDLLIVDPIYLLRPPRTFRDNPFAEIGAIAEGLERIAEEYNIPIIITNQANRVGGPKDEAPHKDRSYNSDVPAQLADYVIGVKHYSDDNRILVRCTKNRWGENFAFEMYFNANTGVFKDMGPLPNHSLYNGSDDAGHDELSRSIYSAIKKEDGN